MSIFIGGAWPYTNESLHLGHVAALLPGDVLARYHRQKGEDVLYVSGSDCHGTPICIRANLEKVKPAEIAGRYHEEFSQCFKQLGFSYDLYSRTDHPGHHQVVQDVLKKLIECGSVYEKQVKQTFCNSCNMFLPDRYIEGECPVCGKSTRGDQCEFCSALLEPSDLINRKCKICGDAPIERQTGHLFFELSKFQKKLEKYVGASRGWRENAFNLSKRYLREGLKDRTVTRDLPWGVDVPLEGFKGKKVYVWIDAVCGYLSASKLICQERGVSWEKYWQGDVKAYYVHGKDNIPFHSLILPALLLGAGNLHLPDRIISSEYLTIEGNKFSKSRNWAVWVPYILEHYQPDSIRYFLLANGPERRDSDFSWREFINRHNGELLGAFGNLVNRTLTFINKYYEGKVPNGKTFREIKTQTKALYKSAGTKIEDGEFKAAVEQSFLYVRSANKFFDEQQPWIKIKTEPEACANAIYTLVQIIANLSNLLNPYLPFSCDKIREFLGLAEPSWGYIETKPRQIINNLEILFQRIDKDKIEEETRKLGQSEK